MSEDKRDRKLADWLAPDFMLIAEPDEKDAWTIVFSDTFQDQVSAASPSGLMTLLKTHPSMLKCDRHQGDHWLHEACPVRYGLLNAAVKCRTDPQPGPNPDAGETRNATPPVDLSETKQTVLPLIEKMALLGEIEGVANIDSIRRKLRALESHAIHAQNFCTERTYFALGGLRFALHQAEQHPRYVAYKAAFEYGRALILDRQKTWDEVVKLAEDLH